MQITDLTTQNIPIPHTHTTYNKQTGKKTGGGGGGPTHVCMCHMQPTHVGFKKTHTSMCFFRHMHVFDKKTHGMCYTCHVFTPACVDMGLHGLCSWVFGVSSPIILYLEVGQTSLSVPSYPCTCQVAPDSRSGHFSRWSPKSGPKSYILYNSSSRMYRVPIKIGTA